MPDETAPTTDTATVETATDTAAPPAYVFPFDVPADLAVASTEDLRNLHTVVREHAATFAGLPPNAEVDPLHALRACRDLAVAITGELTERRDRADEAGDIGDELAALDVPLPADVADMTVQPEDADDEPAAAPAAVTAARRAVPRAAPRVRDVARGSRAPQVPGDTGTSVFGSMTASASVPGFTTGQRLEHFTDAARVLSHHLDQFPQQPTRRTGYPANKRPVTVYDPEGRRLELKTYVRQGGVQLRREFPAELRVDDGSGEGRGYDVAQYAAGERRLPGGSLLRSAELSAKAGRSLTAAAGWCAPSESILDLCELESLDGMLDAPELQTSRGGWQIPEDGGPDFTAVWDGIGSDGDTHLTEAEVIADTAKVCTEIPCPDFEEVRLGVDYFCLTGSLLQRRGYPEVVARWGRAAVTALEHKKNFGFIAAIVAGSGAPVIIGGDPSGDDAASGLLGAAALAIEDIKYRNRMGFNSTVEIVLPHWALVQVRAALSRRTGVALLDVSDAQIMAWFTQRGAVVRFVYDWQDAFSGLATGPGGATPLAALPVTVQFLAYPAGTWVKAVQDVVSLDTIYDSTMLATNQYTAVFVEDGWAALKMCNTSRIYTARVDPSGVVGCCPAEEIS